jgi:hypothetical protein
MVESATNQHFQPLKPGFLQVFQGVELPHFEKSALSNSDSLESPYTNQNSTNAQNYVSSRSLLMEQCQHLLLDL